MTLKVEKLLQPIFQRYGSVSLCLTFLYQRDWTVADNWYYKADWKFNPMQTVQFDYTVI